MVAAVGPFLWGRPYGELLYGQDSVRTVQPFSFNDTPFVPYSYLYSSSFPVPDFTPNFYLDATLRAFESLGSPDWVSQRFLLAIFVGLAAAGIVVLLRSIEGLRGTPRSLPGWVFGAAALVYVYNPFTLTVTFWHVEGWAPFLAFLPWAMALVVRVAFETRIPLRFAAAVVLLGTYLAPGVVSSFAVPLTFILLGGVAAVWLRRPSPLVRLRRRVGKTAVLLGVGLGLEAWGFVPLLALPKVAYSNNNYVNPTNLVQIYHAAAWTWGPYPVVTLTAFSWLRATPSAYPWVAILPVVAAAAVVFPLLIVLGAVRLRTSPGSLFVYTVGLFAVPFLIGAGTEPIASWNLRLLALGGPFLVLVAAYYIIGPVYLLVPVVGLYETLRERVPAGRSPASPPSAEAIGSRPATRSPSVLVAAAVIVLLLLSAAPFVVGDVYQTSGPNADTVAVPPSFSALARYFGTPANGPNSFVLIVPMSSQEGPFLNLGGRQFLDTSNLLASYIPYPIVEADTGILAAALEEDLALGTPTNLSALLDSLHVASVVVNPFANVSAPAMNEAPNGAPIDWRAFLAALPTQLGPGSAVGRFTVYSVPHALPLGWATSSITSIDTSDPATAFALLGSVRSGPPSWAASLASAVWDPNSSLPGWRLHPTVVAGPSSTISAPAGSAASVVDADGSWSAVPCRSGFCTSNGTQYAWGANTVIISGDVERSTDSAQDWGSATNRSASGFCTADGTFPALYATGMDSAPAFVGLNGSFSSLASQDWVNIQLSVGRLGLLAEVFQPGAGGTASLSLSASSDSVPFAWENVFLPASLAPNQSFALVLTWNASSAGATVSAGGSTSSSAILFGNSSTDESNPGFNASAVPPGETRIPVANVSVGIVGGTSCIASAQVVRPPSVRLLIDSAGTSPTSAPAVSVDGRVTPSGDVVVSAAGGANKSSPEFAVLGFPENSLWVPSATSGAAVRVLSGTPLANVVELVGGDPGAVVTFHFRTYLILGLEASWVQGVGLIAVLVVLTWLPRRASRRDGRPRVSSNTLD
ncbi:MAG: hypothetical protein L3K18_00590 [Thermoplasmata archaeon]|nr:hypothetical protein [Thermoplasmata archaeon]